MRFVQGVPVRVIVRSGTSVASELRRGLAFICVGLQADLTAIELGRHRGPSVGGADTTSRCCIWTILGNMRELGCIGARGSSPTIASIQAPRRCTHALTCDSEASAAARCRLGGSSHERLAATPARRRVHPLPQVRWARGARREPSLTAARNGCLSESVQPKVTIRHRKGRFPRPSRGFAK
jgi:hypothetical protein